MHGAHGGKLARLRPSIWTLAMWLTAVTAHGLETPGAVPSPANPELSPWPAWWLWPVAALAAGVLAAAAYHAGRRRTSQRSEPSASAEQLDLVNALLNREIERRDRSERERARASAELEARNAEMERFNYAASHDLKNPLVTVLGFVGALRQDLDRSDLDRAAKDLERIDAAARKMAQLLDEMLELSRVGVLLNPRQPVGLGELARQVVASLAGEIARRGVEVEIAADLPVVDADPVRLREVLHNLVDNAIRFSGEDERPRLEIGWRRQPPADGRTPVFFVRDNGIGVDRRYQEKIFGLFERLDVGRGGTGIGLALVKRIVELHGGRIWVESEGSGRGSAFCFTLEVAGGRAAG